ncbi:MAG: helix-turn-helix domain-containing protein [Gammaproteobacteria bacterium]|nr:helix-turn-helix domain-containing protein [Gammaproteobacteria bacterium]
MADRTGGHMGCVESLIAWSALGDLKIAELGADTGRRYGRGLATSVRACEFSLYVPLDGEGTVRQDGREALLHGGDFILCDGGRPHEIQLDGGSRLLALAIPTAKIRRYIACPESLSAVPMRASTGVSGLLSGFLRSFWLHCRQSIEDAPAAQIAVAILELLGAAYAAVPRTNVERSVRGTTHRIRILNYIHAHLYDADLTPMKIAVACGITTRYLHYLFSDGDETVARYILKCRLDACSQALLSGSQLGRTVTSIAFDHGFNSATHFGRVFRSYFGTTPREFRARGAGDGRVTRASEAPAAAAAGY